MKRLALIQFALMVIIAITALQLHAQKLYVSAGAGYGLSIIKNTTNIDQLRISSGTDYITWDGTNTVESFTNYSKDEVKLIKGTGSYGKGFQAGVTVGYMINDYLGAEVNVSYLFGSEIQKSKSTTIRQSIDIYTDLVNPLNDSVKLYTSSDIINGNSKASMIRLIPGIRITIPDWKVKPYIRLGLVIGLATKIESNTIYSFTATNVLNDNSEISYKYTGGTSIGFAGGLGASIEVIKNLSVYADAGIITQTWCPKKSVMTKCNNNGVDILDQFPVVEKETEFVNGYTNDFSTPYDNTIPTKATKVSFPFSTIGFSVGLTYSFGLK
jgi:opacity protein-like surface antigen